MNFRSKPHCPRSFGPFDPELSHGSPWVFSHLDLLQIGLESNNSVPGLCRGFPFRSIVPFATVPACDQVFQKTLEAKRTANFLRWCSGLDRKYTFKPKTTSVFLRWFPGKFFFHWASYLMNYRASKIEIQKSDSTRFVHSSPRVLSRDQSW